MCSPRVKCHRRSHNQGVSNRGWGAPAAASNVVAEKGRGMLGEREREGGALLLFAILGIYPGEKFDVLCSDTTRLSCAYILCYQNVNSFTQLLVRALVVLVPRFVSFNKVDN